MKRTTASHRALQAASQQVIAGLMTRVKGVKAVLVSTEDGFEVASQAENTAQTSRLAAMASSLAALCDVAGEESRLGGCENVTISAEQGHIIMMQVPRPELNLILSVITGKDAVMGLALYFAKLGVQELQHASASAIAA